MLIDQYVTDVRRQMTGEALMGARDRLSDLRDWSHLLPAAKDRDQERLESYLLQSLGDGRGRHPLGVEEVIPYADQLVLRLESKELLAPLLLLLPHRDRHRSRHGVSDLRASTAPRGIELVLGRAGLGRVLVLGPQDYRFDAALDAYRQEVEDRGHIPLWTKDTPHDPMPRPMRRSRPGQTMSKTAKPVDPHHVKPRLASALLRRLHLWDSLAAGSTLAASAELHESGLAWTVERCLPRSHRVHDDNVAAALAESVAGPGLIADADGHRCDEQQCVQTFDSARLTVRTVHGTDDLPARRPGRARAHVLATFLREPHPEADLEAEGRAGHVLQLIDPWGDGPTDAAEQLAAVWAQQGLYTLVLRVDGKYPHGPATASWHRARLTGGSGAMFTGTTDFGRDALKATLARARAEFDHIIMVKHRWSGMSLLGFSPLADDHLIVTGSTFPRTTKSATVRAGELQRRTITLTPAESAMAWLHSRLARVPFADLPMAGLLLHGPHEERGPDAFDSMVDTELARHGMPVLGRLPQPPRRSPHRTVLDHLPAEQRAFVTEQSTQVRRGLGRARADATVSLTAMREYAEF